MLATLDPIAAMAATDKQKLDELFQDIQSDNENVQKLISDIAEKEQMLSPEFKSYDESVADGISVCVCPTCGHEHAKKD